MPLDSLTLLNHQNELLKTLMKFTERLESLAGPAFTPSPTLLRAEQVTKKVDYMVTTGYWNDSPDAGLDIA